MFTIITRSRLKNNNKKIALTCHEVFIILAYQQIFTFYFHKTEHSVKQGQTRIIIKGRQKYCMCKITYLCVCEYNA